MQTKPALLLLGALLFAPTLPLLHAQHPGRTGPGEVKPAA
jgi:hypothetical protein